VNVNDILKSAIMKSEAPPRDSWSFGTVEVPSPARTDGLVEVVLDGDTDPTAMASTVPCSDGDRVLVLLLGGTRVVTGVIGATCPYAVGDYFMTEGTTPPGTRWPGTTWVELAGRVLVGRDTTQTEFDTVGEQGGSKDAVLLAHTHVQQLNSGDNGTGSHVQMLSEPNDGTSRTGSAVVDVNYATSTRTPVNTQSAGVADTNNQNLPPYRVCYVWRRTA